MAKKGIKLKIEHSSIPFLYLILALPLLIAILAQFNVISLTKFVPAILTILAGLFVMSEVGVMGMIRQKKLGKDLVRIFGVVVAVTAIVLATISIFMTFPAVLSGAQGVVNILLVIYVLIEGFR